jgi:hypothetical protein
MIEYFIAGFMLGVIVAALIAWLYVAIGDAWGRAVKREAETSRIEAEVCNQRRREADRSIIGRS